MFIFLFFKQKTAYEMRIRDWSSDVCSSDLGCASIPGVAEMVEEQLGVQTVVANPLAQMTPGPRVQAHALAQDAPALLIACGPALRSFDCWPGSTCCHGAPNPATTGRKNSESCWPSSPWRGCRWCYWSTVTPKARSQGRAQN